MPIELLAKELAAITQAYEQAEAEHQRLTHEKKPWVHIRTFAKYLPEEFEVRTLVGRAMYAGLEIQQKTTAKYTIGLSLQINGDWVEFIRIPSIGAQI